MDDIFGKTVWMLDRNVPTNTDFLCWGVFEEKRAADLEAKRLHTGVVPVAIERDWSALPPVPSGGNAEAPYDGKPVLIAGRGFVCQAVWNSVTWVCPDDEGYKAEPPSDPIAWRPMPRSPFSEETDQ